MLIYLDEILMLKAVHAIKRDEVYIWTAFAILAGGIAGIKVFKSFTRRDLFFTLNLIISLCLLGIGYCINS